MLEAKRVASKGVHLNRGLVDSFVRQGARARDDCNLPRGVNVARHNSNLAFARFNDARAVGANQPRFGLTQQCFLHFDLPHSSVNRLEAKV